MAKMMTRVLFERSGPRRSCTVTAPIADMPVDLATAWSTWLDRHGVEPDDVLVGWPIVCDDDTRRIEWTAAARDAEGRGRVVDGDLVLEMHHVQLEARALPMPNEPELLG